MNSIGYFHELKRYNKRQRTERLQETLGRALFVGMCLYIAIMALAGVA